MRVRHSQRTGCERTRGVAPEPRATRRCRVAARRCRVAGLRLLLSACFAGCSGAPPPAKPPVVVVPATPPPPAPEPEELRLEFTDEEKAALSARAALDLQETERLIGTLDRERLTAEETEKLRTVESLIHAAKSAEEKGDIPGLANLAHKARLLAEELISG